MSTRVPSHTRGRGANLVRSNVRLGSNGRVRSLFPERSPLAQPTPSAKDRFLAFRPFIGPGAIQFWMGPDTHLLHYAIGGYADYVNFFAVVEYPKVWLSISLRFDPGFPLRTDPAWRSSIMCRRTIWRGSSSLWRASTWI